MTLLDERGQRAGSLRLSEEPRVAVETGRGREVAGLGAPKVNHLIEQATVKATVVGGRVVFSTR